MMKQPPIPINSRSSIVLATPVPQKPESLIDLKSVPQLGSNSWGHKLQ